MCSNSDFSGVNPMGITYSEIELQQQQQLSHVVGYVVHSSGKYLIYINDLPPFIYP